MTPLQIALVIVAFPAGVFGLAVVPYLVASDGASYTAYGGQHKITQDESPAGKALAVFEGSNCFRVFGE